MPGPATPPHNIAALAAATGAHEFHASAKRQLPSAMRHRHPLLEDMQAGELRSDVGQVRAMAAALATAAQDATRL
jgi:copper homeostasis protein